MYCNHCGKPNEDGAKVCTSCGLEIQRTEDAAAPRNTPAASTANRIDVGEKFSEISSKVDVEKIKTKLSGMDKKKLATYGGIAGGALAVIIAIIVIISACTSNVSLKKYMKEELVYSGINGYGTAETSDLIDFDSLNQAVQKKNLSKRDYYEYYYYGDNDIEDYISYELASENNGKLSNGDMVEITVKVDKDAIKNNKLFGKKISGGKEQSFKYKVAGLEEGTAIDLFDAVECVSIDTTSYNSSKIVIKDGYTKQYEKDGINVKEEDGKIRVYGDNFNSFTVYMSLASDNFDENSKTVKVSADSDADAYKDYGIVFKQTEADVNVSAISYVRYNTISKEDLTKLTEKVNEVAKEKLGDTSYSIVKAVLYYDADDEDNCLMYYVSANNKIYKVYYNYLKQYSDGKIVNVNKITPDSYMTFISFKSIDEAEKSGLTFTEKVEIPLSK